MSTYPLCNVLFKSGPTTTNSSTTTTVNATTPVTFDFYELQALMSYWLNGPMTLTVVCLGSVLNGVNLLVFLQPRLKRQGRPVIYNYLICLTVWDLLLCVSATGLYSLPTIYFGRLTLFAGRYTHVFPYVYYLSNCTLTGSVWMIMALTVDRFLALCYPLWHRRALDRNRVWTILLSLTAGAFAYGIPEFFKLIVNYCVKMDVTDGGVELTPFITESRFSASIHYSFVYRMLGGFMLYSLVPFTLLLALTTFIWFRMHRAAAQRRALTKQSVRMRKCGASCSTLKDYCTNSETALKPSRRYSKAQTAMSTTSVSITGLNVAANSRPKAQSYSIEHKKSTPDLRTAGRKRSNTISNGRPSSSMLISCNSSIATTVQQQRQAPFSRSSSVLNGGQPQASSSSSGDAMLMSVIVKFVLCRFMCVILDIMERVNYHAFIRSRVTNMLVDVSNLLVVINSATNFWLYFMFSRRFKHALFELRHGTFFTTHTSGSHILQPSIAQQLRVIANAPLGMATSPTPRNRSKTVSPKEDRNQAAQKSPLLPTNGSSNGNVGTGCKNLIARRRDTISVQRSSCTITVHSSNGEQSVVDVEDIL